MREVRAANGTLPQLLHVVIYEAQTGCWVSHCLESDDAMAWRTVEEARESMVLCLCGGRHEEAILTYWADEGFPIHKEAIGLREFDRSTHTIMLQWEDRPYEQWTFEVAWCHLGGN